MTFSLPFTSGTQRLAGSSPHVAPKPAVKTLQPTGRCHGAGFTSEQTQLLLGESQQRHPDLPLVLHQTFSVSLDCFCFLISFEVTVDSLLLVVVIAVMRICVFVFL